MGLISNTLLGPVRLVTWTAAQIRDAAEAQLYDPEAIRRELVQLNADLDDGTIDEAQFQAAEDELMARLEYARTRPGST